MTNLEVFERLMKEVADKGGMNMEAVNSVYQGVTARCLCQIADALNELAGIEVDNEEREEKEDVD